MNTKPLKQKSNSFHTLLKNGRIDIHGVGKTEITEGLLYRECSSSADMNLFFHGEIARRQRKEACQCPKRVTIFFQEFFKLKKKYFRL